MDHRVIVLFRSRLLPDAGRLHDELVGPVEAAARLHPGIESFRSYSAADGERVTIVWLRDDEALATWAADPAHRSAKARAHEIYEWFETTITRTGAPGPGEAQSTAE